MLNDLNKICSDKKNLLNVKTQELKSVSERLKHCQKFAEAAVTSGSETALVYSKKPIMNQVFNFTSLIYLSIYIIIFIHICTKS